MTPTPISDGHVADAAVDEPTPETPTEPAAEMEAPAVAPAAAPEPAAGADAPTADAPPADLVPAVAAASAPHRPTNSCATSWPRCAGLPTRPVTPASRIFEARADEQVRQLEGDAERRRDELRDSGGAGRRRGRGVGAVRERANHQGGGAASRRSPQPRSTSSSPPMPAAPRRRRRPSATASPSTSASWRLPRPAHRDQRSSCLRCGRQAHAEARQPLAEHGSSRHSGGHHASRTLGRRRRPRLVRGRWLERHISADESPAAEVSLQRPSSTPRCRKPRQRRPRRSSRRHPRRPSRPGCCGRRRRGRTGTQPGRGRGLRPSGCRSLSQLDDTEPAAAAADAAPAPCGRRADHDRGGRQGAWQLRGDHRIPPGTLGRRRHRRVALSLGQTGEFVFRATHAPGFDVRAAITAARG